jgi:hypothetical protein
MAAAARCHVMVVFAYPGLRARIFEITCNIFGLIVPLFYVFNVHIFYPKF